MTSEPPRPPPGSKTRRLSRPPPPLLGQALEEQARRWRQGERVPAEAFLGRSPELAADPEALLDLIYHEMLLREEEGERPGLDEYQARFPQVAADLALQFEVERALEPDRPGGAAEPAVPSVPGYEVLGVLGRGGTGVVYKARQVGLNRLVALKMVLAGAHAGSRELARFRTEAEAVARLQHPNIVQVYEVGAHEGRPFLALELVETSLARNLSGAVLPPRQAAQWAETLARTVQHAHERGVIHRDLKPANVLLSRDGVLKLTDFGLAKILAGEPGGQTQTGSILGTPSYMAPEQAEGQSRQVGPATDVYGLGAILYEFLTGRPPFRADTTHQTLQQVCLQEPTPPSRLRPGVPRDLETICLKCLEKEPARRYAAAEELAAELSAFLAGESIRSRRAGPIERLGVWARRRPAEAALWATGGVALAGLGVGLMWSNALAVGAVAGLSLLAGSWWYSARLQRALHEVTRQQVLAERAVERLHLLLEMTRRLMRATRRDDLLLLLAETTARLANAELATIYLVDRQRGELWSTVTLDPDVGEIRLPLGVGLAGTVAVTGEPVNLPDAYADPRFNPEVDRRTGHKTRNLLTMPLKAQGGRVLGVFQVINKRDGAFGVEDIEILSTLAGSASVAIERFG